MFRTAQLTPRTLVKIVVRSDTEHRLSEKCFRGQYVAAAGNFLLFERAEHIFARESIWVEFLSRAKRKILALSGEGRSNGLFSFTMSYPDVVGWSSTDSRERYSQDALEVRNLNNRSTAQFVKPDSGSLAPLTHFITFVCQVKKEDGAWAIIVHSIYPGTDVGELHGDMTEREGLVWFDWNHPGKPWK